MLKRTPLYAEHVNAGAILVDFAGWEMPIRYGSQLQEHRVVREDAGMFDVSHMTVLDVTGKGGRDFLRYLLANDVARLSENQALYSCMLNETGGVIDDLIVYYLQESPCHYRVIVNAATREKDIAWIKGQAKAFDVTIAVAENTAMIAVQGPNALAKLSTVLPETLVQQVCQLKRFQACTQGGWFIARTGYTGEDGVEIVLPASEAAKLWQDLTQAGVMPCGLGARDTLRLEAGMHLYGTDMNEEVTPLESGLGWTVSYTDDRDFIGKAALLKQKADGVDKRFVGLVLEDKGVLRNDQVVVCDGLGEGKITSGSFSPTLNSAIALARIPKGGQTTHCHVKVRSRLLNARIVKLPFVREGKAVCE